MSTTAIATPVTPPATSPAAGALPADTAHALHLLRELVRIRRFEERAAELYRAEKVRGFLHLYIGEEAIAVGVMQALGPDDAIVSTYREHGHALARGMNARTIMAELYGKQEGYCQGRGGSMHLFDLDTRFYGGDAIVGSGLPLALGLALADHMQHRPRVTACFFGDGAVAEGAFHETLNMAALWHLPILFCCENNLYEMGTPLACQHSETNLAAKAAAYRLPACQVDGMNVEAVERAAHDAVQAIRDGAGPQFIEFLTYRFRSHSMFDPDPYRPHAEIAEWMQRCPIKTFTARLLGRHALDDAGLATIEAEVAREVDDAVAFAEAGTWEPVESLTRHVYSDGEAGR